jgi:hypothetical protein
LVVTGERRIIKLALGEFGFPTTNMQEHTWELGHIDLVLSQLSMDVLQEIQMDATQEMKMCSKKTSTKLVNLIAKNVALGT